MSHHRNIAEALTLLCCHSCNILFHSKEDAIRHGRGCQSKLRQIQAQSNIGPLASIHAPRPKTLRDGEFDLRDDAYLCYQSVSSENAVFIFHVKNRAKIRLYGLAAAACGIPPLDIDLPRRWALWRNFPAIKGRNKLYRDMLVHIQDEWITMTEARRIATHFGFNKALQDIWDLVSYNPTESLLYPYHTSTVIHALDLFGGR
ncbi:hypothetical protein BKA66DRAFT_224942 [Pyrenochaeta sp. MPI-SDFR-AT-0127]|nr:hypothetical protein BKA66DRAFT_224942 [Pyrenochaeta sp. MPI-SDFR-AT-0127]